MTLRITTDPVQKESDLLSILVDDILMDLIGVWIDLGSIHAVASTCREMSSLVRNDYVQRLLLRRHVRRSMAKKSRLLDRALKHKLDCVISNGNKAVFIEIPINKNRSYTYFQADNMYHIATRGRKTRRSKCHWSCYIRRDGNDDIKFYD